MKSALKILNKILYIVGARPNFIKISPLIQETKKYNNIKPILVHTGQHYDWEMSKVFFDELKIPKPDYNLEVGSGTHAWQTAQIMEKLEPILLKEQPKLLVVVGDVNSTLAGALVAAKLHIPVAHVEAGLRSFDKNMPEEINRLLTDHISDYLFTTEPQANKNLINEGISKSKIFYVGNVMIDTLKNQISNLQNQKYLSKIESQFKLKLKNYAVLTLHRPENVDNKNILGEILGAVNDLQERIKIIWPIHPRTQKVLKNFKTYKLKNLKIIKPLGYIDFLALVSQSKFVLTDSGGIQEETTVLGVPCLTLREVTERPITVKIGTNIVVGTKKEKIIKEVQKILRGKIKKGRIPKYWDGEASKRILKIFIQIIKYGKF